MHTNWNLVLIYYAVAIAAVATMYVLAKKIGNEYLRLFVRAGIAATLLTPWFLVGEGVAVVPASIIMVFGGSSMDWEEFLWGAAPIATLWVILFVIGALIILIRQRREGNEHAV